MRLKRILFFLLAAISLPVFSQVNLPFSINSGILPNDTDHISVPLTYIDTTNQFISSGFGVNSIVADFTLFDTLGNPTTLSATLNLGKPVLLVSVSLSCPSSRHSITHVLYDIVAMFGNQINILLVYVIEPHPISPDFSPYFNGVWTTSNNVIDSILIRQETDYLQRKQKCEDFITRYGVNVPVLIDGPGNEYWSTFGPAPNNAYLITTNGMVFSKYGWFDQSKINLINDISSLLIQANVSHPEINTNARIFPNPSNGNSTLAVENETNYSLQIIDITGRVVSTEKNISASTFDLGKYNLDAGVYSLVVETKNGQTFCLNYIVQ